MIIMQYDIKLADDYDMSLIAQRVAEKGAAFDTFPGLGLKCFVVREKGRFGAAGNEYAPIYLWPDSQAMGAFIAGPAFAAVTAAFGRPPTRTWSTFAFARSRHPHTMTSIVSVTRECVPLPADTDLSTLQHRENAAANRAVEDRDGPLIRVVGVDPNTWQRVRFDYWRQLPSTLAPDNDVYSVLHVSAPEIDSLMAPSPSAP